jgi:hypothetical protein
VMILRDCERIPELGRLLWDGLVEMRERGALALIVHTPDPSEDPQ